MFQNNTANDDGGVIFQVKELTPPFMCCLLLYKTVLIIRVYKSWLLNSFLYFNTVVFTISPGIHLMTQATKTRKFFKELLLTFHCYYLSCVQIWQFKNILLRSKYKT